MVKNRMKFEKQLIIFVAIGLAAGLILGNIFGVPDCSNTSRPILAALVGDQGCPKKFNSGWFLISILIASTLGIVLSKRKR